LKKKDFIGLNDKNIAFSFNAKFYSDSASKCNFSLIISSNKKILKNARFTSLPKEWNTKWETISFKDTLDSIPENIKFYLWNQDTSYTFYIDDLKLSFRQLPY